jgi:hypothetical protein
MRVQLFTATSLLSTKGKAGGFHDSGMPMSLYCIKPRQKSYPQKSQIEHISMGNHNIEETFTKNK